MALLTILSVFIALLAVWVASRVLAVSRILSATTSLPRTWTWAPPFDISNVFFPTRMQFDAPQAWATKFDRYLERKSTAFYAYSPFHGPATILLADAGAIKEVGQDPVVFGKPLEMYQVVCLWGPNLVALEHDEWRRHRKLVAPTFSEANNKLVWKHCIRVCDEWFEYMDANSMDGVYEDLDILGDTMRMALMVISSAGFGKSFPWKDEEGVTGKNGHKMTFGVALQGLMNDFVMRILLPKWAYFLPIKRVQECASYYTEFEQYMREMIAERRQLIASGDETDDVFSILLRESDKETGSGRLSELELLSDTYIMLLAGHETTGHTLATTLFMLALYPEAQKKLYEEAKQFIGDDVPAYGNLSSLKWSTATINETLRLFPPIVTIPKRATADTTLTVQTLPSKLGGTSVPTQCFIPAGTNVRLDAHALHHNPLYWEDSTAFKPERFIDTDEKRWNRDAFIAFSVGQRGCIGKGFAMVEATIVLSKILLTYEIKIPDSLAEKYAKRAEETEDQRVRRLYNATHALTITPNGLGVSFVRRKV